MICDDAMVLQWEKQEKVKKKTDPDIRGLLKEKDNFVDV